MQGGEERQRRRKGGGKSGKKRYDHLIRICFIFISYYSRHFFSLSLSLPMYLCGNKEGEAVNRWGDEGKQQQRDCDPNPNP